MANSPPMYTPGDKVVRSSSGAELTFRGRILEIIPPDAIPAVLGELAKHNPAYAEATINRWSEKDPDFQQFHCYMVEPDSSPGMATFEEAAHICPGLTKLMYDMIVGNLGRRYMVIESELLDAADEPSTH